MSSGAPRIRPTFTTLRYRIPLLIAVPSLGCADALYDGYLGARARRRSGERGGHSGHGRRVGREAGRGRWHLLLDRAGAYDVAFDDLTLTWTR